jgi:hypothetical protein
MNDGRGPLDRGPDTLARRQVTPHELDAVVVLVAPAAEHSEPGVTGSQPREDEAPERAGTAGDESAFIVWRRSVHIGSAAAVSSR